MLCQALAAWDESLTSIIQSSRCLPHFSCLRVQHEEVLHLQKSNFVYEQSDVGSKTVTVNWILCMISYSFKPLQMAGAPTLQMLCSIARLQTHALLASSWQVLQRYLKNPLCLSLLLSSFLSFKLYQKSCTLEARAQQCLRQSDESDESKNSSPKLFNTKRVSLQPPGHHIPDSLEELLKIRRCFEDLWVTLTLWVWRHQKIEHQSISWESKGNHPML